MSAPNLFALALLLLATGCQSDAERLGALQLKVAQAQADLLISGWELDSATVRLVRERVAAGQMEERVARLAPALQLAALRTPYEGIPAPVDSVMGELWARQNELLLARRELARFLR